MSESDNPFSITDFLGGEGAEEAETSSPLVLADQTDEVDEEEQAKELPAPSQPVVFGKSKSRREGMKRIHVQIGKKKTSLSMDMVLFSYLEDKLTAAGVSARQWAQSLVDRMEFDSSGRSRGTTVSLSRRIQAEAIHVVAGTSTVERN